MNSITQDMKYRQSLLTYAQKYGVSRAGRKYNKSRSYIYFWRARYDGSLQSLACQSRRPHSHPNQHTPEELKLISDMHRRNPKLGIVELWARMRKRGYTRTIESLWRVMRREGWTAQGEKKKPYKPKPYEQMQYPGQRVQIDVKVVPRRCIADPQLKLYQYTAIDEYSRYRVLGAYEEQSTFSSADFLSKVVKHFARKGVAVDVIKDRGALAREQGNGDIENIYLLKVMNAAEHASTYRVSVQGLPGMTLVTPAALDVPATGIGSLTVRLALGAQAAQAYRGRAIPITFKVQRADTDREVAIEEKSTFVIPR